MIRVDSTRRELWFEGRGIPCAIGKSGAVPEAAKREGDGASPLGRYALLGALLRPDRVRAPAMDLPWRSMRPWDGWCDAPADPLYNRPVAHPWRSSAERLWRDDHVYDVIVVLNHNSAPVVPGAGSAIFWHLTSPDRSPTEGCIAIDAARMLEMLPKLKAGMPFEIG
ncbi:L,D-transpeptidase family protein [Sandaracinobacter sp. RS1-74]|uniref:L,D-transpeptidase family protein n=1 Tax=Sandaracinobacteroides sayramensis TaxID=2913411 RepID=UPI001EDA75BB|nr:L,D-transpeptidase family protein [Sandaracinobacteroides sayramensis]MCG2841488.1 L,D-transpeptidase family protein [Sandaracinobacteroides sayramensis]